MLGIKVKQKREIEKRVPILNVVCRDGQKDISRREHQAQERASKKVQGGHVASVFTEQQEGQCGWNRVIQGENSRRQNLSLSEVRSY